MHDRTGHDLMTLAPEVDMTAARTAFARRRAQARRRRRVGSAALASLAVLAGAGIWSALPDDDGVTVDFGVATAPDGPTPTAPPLTTPPTEDSSPADPTPDPSPVIGEDGGCVRPPGSSPSTFDEAHGLYAAHLGAFDPTASTLTFDLVQWLTGDDAVEAYRHDEPGSTDGPPNDYYVVNESHAVRTLPVAPDVAIARLAPKGDPDLQPGTLSALPDHLATDFDESVYWLTVSDGTVTGICEQYRP